MNVDSILATIGNTPHVRVNASSTPASRSGSSRSAQPGGSIKDRIALSMVEEPRPAGLSVPAR